MNAKKRTFAFFHRPFIFGAVTLSVVVLVVLLLWPESSNTPGDEATPATNTDNDSMPATEDDGHAATNIDGDSMPMTEHEGHAAMQSPGPHAGHLDVLAPEEEFWSCSMHPHIQRDKPGQCPICGIDLIRVRQNQSSADDEPRQLTISPAQRALMKIETVPVERRFPTAELRLVGKVTYDETRLSYITAWVPGRIDDLLVDYTGVTVQKGDHMVKLYSPELLSAQEELLQAHRGLIELSKSNVSSLRSSALGTVESARDKLRLWGLGASQIKKIERTGKASEHVTIYSPASGVVIDRNAQEGMYVDIGTRIFTIADLNAVWVQLDAYESDLRWLRYGQNVSFTTEAYPGENFNGIVSFIDPVLNPTTRTVKVRVNVDNKEGLLKPEMFVRANVFAQFAGSGRILDENLIGKWVSPMHPEVVKDAPGQCPICGMKLVPSESLGYANTTPSDAIAPLVIPATAALLTGKRAVVYVEVPDSERPSYIGREVVLGPRAGADYVVESGLSEGDLVVVSGNFKIDSALQILAKPSMMNPKGGGSGGGHNHGGG